MAEWNRDTSWRQGQLLTEEAILELGLSAPGKIGTTLVIVATHDCDIVQPPTSEPAIEVLVGTRIAKLDGNCTHAKSARKLHMQIQGASACNAEFIASEKRSIPKDKIGHFNPHPDMRLAPQDKRTYQSWLADRYRRSAFPDEFERRLAESGLAEKIKRIAQQHGEDIIGLLFEVDEGVDVQRAPGDDPYVLDVVILHADEPDFATAEASAEKMKREIEQAFRSARFDREQDSIELRYVDPASEGSLTYSAYKRYRRWRLDHLSHADGSTDKVVDT